MILSPRCVVALVCMFIPLVSFADVTISGTVFTADGRTPLPGVSVRVTAATDSTKIHGAISNPQGSFIVRGLVAGTYRVSCNYLGYARYVNDKVTVGDAGTTLSIAMKPELLAFNGVVVTATRQVEKVIDAPASVSVVNATTIAETPAFTPVDHLRSVPGVDVEHSGLLATNIVARGFNSVFNGELMILTDNRLSAIPALHANIPYFIPITDDDIERMELVRGPGSALYGPNATSGVLNIITKSPFAYQGTTISLTGGERSLAQIAFRHAGTVGDKFGYKISGQYFRGMEWPEAPDPAEIAARDAALAGGASADTLRIGKRIPMLQRWSGEARVDGILGENIVGNLTFGLHTSVNSIDHTDIGASVADNWMYMYLQGHLTIDKLFIQSYINRNDGGKSYVLNTGAYVVDHSTQWVTQVQHSASIGSREQLTYGLDALLTNPSTDGTVYGKYESNDAIREFGGYLQSQTGLWNNGEDAKLDLILAGRLDEHSRVDGMIFSPRAGLLYKPSDDHTFRATFNRAYSAPSSTDMFLDVVASPNPFGFPAGNEIAMRAQGTIDGFTFDHFGNTPGYVFHSAWAPPGATFSTDSAADLWPVIVGLLKAKGLDISAIPAPRPDQVHSAMAMLNTTTGTFSPVTTLANISKIAPTTTETFEVGYKGIVNHAWEIGVDVYHSKVSNFRSPLMLITPNVFLNGTDVAAYTMPYIKQQLIAKGESDSAATAGAAAESATIAGVAGALPLGTVSPKEAVDPNAMILAARNFGSVELNGIDLSVSYAMSDMWMIGGSYSYVDHNFFANLDNVADLALNAPQHKGTLTLRYVNREAHITANALYRHSDGFNMSSGIYIGNVHPYNLVDLSLQYTFVRPVGLIITVNASNVLDDQHQEFIGAPVLGRMVTTRLSFSM